MEMNKAIFYDRDGVINEMVIRGGRAESPKYFSEFRLIKGITRAVLTTRYMGYHNIIVTNQPDIARGKLKLSELYLMHDYIAKNLFVDKIFMCLHDDRDNCNCRKPKIGMMLDAMEKYNLDLSKSFVVGDSWRDVEMARRVGCKSISIQTWYNEDLLGSYVVSNINEVANIILNERRRERDDFSRQ